MESSTIALILSIAFMLLGLGTILWMRQMMLEFTPRKIKYITVSPEIEISSIEETRFPHQILILSLKLLGYRFSPMRLAREKFWKWTGIDLLT